MTETSAYIGLDTHKNSIATAIASHGRDGEVRFYGEIANTPAAIDKLAKRLASKYERLHFCYEAGPCGYGVHRQLTGLGHQCIVVAPSQIPIKNGNRVKNDRRDAIGLARLHRAGELTAIWVPDAAHEAIRDLVRVRTVAMENVRRARQQLQGFLLRHSLIYPGKAPWTKLHLTWIRKLAFEHPAHYIVIQELLASIEDCKDRQSRLEKQIVNLLPSWSLAPVVEAIQAMRGVKLITAVILVSEVGDFRRFSNPRQLMSYLGLAPTEHSSGEKVVRGCITRAGSARARHVLIEAAWSYRLPARVSKKIGLRHDGQSKTVLDIAWKAQLRLCHRFRQMRARGKNHNVVVTAIAREMLGFIWAIACSVTQSPTEAIAA
jgi:transposase